MVELKSESEIAAMREAGRVVAGILAATRNQATVGTTLRDLDELAREHLAQAGAGSPFLNYHPRFAPSPYPAVICASVNDVIVHGIPDGYRLRDGDLLSIDCGAQLDGWTGDAATSFIVGQPRAEDVRLVEAAESALRAAIEATRPGGRLGDLAHAIGTIGRAHRYGIPRGWGGHGIGRAMHEPPDVPNEGRRGRGHRLVPGLVLAIEPMFMAGGRDDFRLAPDGWAVHTADRSRAAHAEHTVAVTADGPQVLTLP
jgi:methionyl aminopeptidase